jgi:excisionase family DNA binding protein
MVANGRLKATMAATKTKIEEIPELLTLKEACEMLKVHPNTLRTWDKKGVLPAIRIGTKRVRRYKKEDILKMLNQKK